MCDTIIWIFNLIYLFICSLVLYDLMILYITMYPLWHTQLCSYSSCMLILFDIYFSVYDINYSHYMMVVLSISSISEATQYRNNYTKRIYSYNWNVYMLYQLMFDALNYIWIFHSSKYKRDKMYNWLYENFIFEWDE